VDVVAAEEEAETTELAVVLSEEHVTHRETPLTK